MRRSSTEKILSIDVGTQSVRACLIDAYGKIHDIVKTEIEPYYSVKPGWAEQDPEYFWKNLSITCKKLLRKASSGKSIAGVTLTTQRDTVINLDSKGRPLRPAIVWLDQRRAKTGKWPPFYLKLVLRMMNLLDAVNYSITESEMNWIKQNQPDIWEKTHRFLFLSGYLNFRLTGEYRDSSGNQVGFVPFDYKKQKWAGKSHHYWKMLDVPESVLPELVRPGDIIGTVTQKASEDTGIPRGLPVVAAATDKACEVLGSGCLTPETACLSYGTTATVETTNEKYVEIIPFLPPFPSAVSGSYNTEVMVYRGFWLVSWFKREFGLKERQIAKKKKIAPEMIFDEMVRDIPPGSLGLTLQPYWSPGVKIPGVEAKGAVIGFGDVHTRAHFYRAILEGLAYALKEGCIRTEKRNRVKIEKVKVSGGGSQSNVAMQLTADIFNMPAEKPSTYETSALGAAIDAAVGLKLHPDFRSAVKDMTGVSEIFEPVKENSEIYGDLYERVYLRMYKKLKPFYEDIMEITGYPSAR